MRRMIIVIALISLLFSALLAEPVIAQEDLPECNVRDEDTPDEPAWNRESCYTNFAYRTTFDWSPRLDECLYNIQSGPPSEFMDCRDFGEWHTACDCSGTNETTCMIAVYIGPDELCSTVGEGTCRICAKAVDRATPPQSGYGERFLDIDFEPPVTAIECNDAACKPDTEWYNDKVGVSLHCNDCDDGDCSGCAETYYCVDQADDCDPDTVYTEPFHVSAEGTNYVRFFSKDIAGNTEAIRSETVRIGEAAEETAWHRVLLTIAVIILVGIAIYFARRQFLQKKKTG